MNQRRFHRTGVVISTVLITMMALTLSADAEKKGYSLTNRDGSTVIVNTTTSTPVSACLVYSTSGIDTTDGVFIQAGLYDCATGHVLDNASCNSGRFRFGETSHAGVYSCSRGSSWSTTSGGIAANVEYASGTSAPYWWNAYVGGSYLTTLSGFGHATSVMAWGENTSSSSTCPSGLHAYSHIYSWKVRADGSTTYTSVGSASAYTVGPSNCLARSAYTAASGFTVSR